jgi:hypothetical protein
MVRHTKTPQNALQSVLGALITDRGDIMAIIIQSSNSYNGRETLTIREQEIVDFWCDIPMKRTYGDSFTFKGVDHTVKINGSTLHHIFLHSLKSSPRFRGAVLTYITNLNNATEVTE